MMRTAKPYTPREFRVALPTAIRTAAIVPLTAPLSPPKPSAEPQPNVVVSAPVSEPASPADPAPAADLWATEVGAHLAADRKAIDAALAALRGSVADLRAEHAGRMHELQTAAVELALTIASKLLHERVTADEFPVEAMIRDMAAEMHEDEVVTVRLNPADLELLERRLDGEPLLPGLTDPRVLPDPSLGRAECRVEGRSSASLSDLPRQLTQIRDDLLGRLAHARS